MTGKYYYWDRMKRAEGNLADIRRAMDVSGRPQKVTMERVEELVCAEIDAMEAEAELYDLKDQVADLIAGCPKHPQYRAIRQPTSDCEVCRRLFYMRKELT